MKWLDRVGRSLLLRLLGVQLLALALIWIVLGGGDLLRAHGEGDAHLASDLVLAANALARIASIDASTAQVRALAEHVRVLNSSQSDPPLREDQFAYQVWTASGTLLARSAESPRLADLRPGSLPDGRPTRRDGWMLLAVTSPNGRVIAVAGHALAYYETVNRAALWALLAGYGQISVITSLVLWLTLRVGLRPLDQLARAVAARQRDDLTPITPPRDYREIAPLVGALNEKLGRIQATVEREREFFADAAHELRTPLSVIAVQAHVVAAERDPEAREAATRTLQDGVGRSARVLNRLLLISRLDAERDSTALQVVDLAEIADDVVSQNRARARAGGQSIALAADALIRRGNRENLTAALECLVDNALRYTPRGTQVVISVHADGADSVITVVDDGPGIPAALHARTFRRFERLGRIDEDGSGLGLAIVLRVAELHGGSASLRDASGGGCVFEMRMPLTTAAADELFEEPAA